ncbi:MAG: hypothetical protein WHX53_15510 [Anaerolineae bacterium]
MKKLAVLLLTLLFVLLAAVPAAAMPPVFQEGEFDDTWLFESGE